MDHIWGEKYVVIKSNGWINNGKRNMKLENQK